MLFALMFSGIFTRKQKGSFDWDGDKDLRKFISLCQKHNMKRSFV